MTDTSNISACRMLNPSFIDPSVSWIIFAIIDLFSPFTGIPFTLKTFNNRFKLNFDRINEIEGNSQTKSGPHNSNSMLTNGCNIWY